MREGKLEGYRLRGLGVGRVEKIQIKTSLKINLGMMKHILLRITCEVAVAVSFLYSSIHSL
jgi:hypothetical protein